MWCPDFDVVVAGVEAVTSVGRNSTLKLQLPEVTLEARLEKRPAYRKLHAIWTNFHHEIDVAVGVIARVLL